MTGKTHKTIGTVVGASVATYGVIKLGDPLYSLLMVTAPFGAMLPDIDHDNSKLGSQRKQAIKISMTLAKLFVVVSLIVLFVYGYVTNTLLSGVIGYIGALVAVCIMYVIATSPNMRKRTSFLTKHRGIMHTLVLPILLIIFCFMTHSTGNRLVSLFLSGIVLGYLSHIFADCLTKAGCPILYPLSKNNISLLPVTTGTAGEYIVGGLLCLISMYTTFLLVQ